MKFNNQEKRNVKSEGKRQIWGEKRGNSEISIERKKQREVERAFAYFLGIGARGGSATVKSQIGNVGPN